MSVETAGPPSQGPTLAEAVVELLQNAGVEKLFGIPGKNLLAFVNACDHAKLPTVTGRHEGASACMAAGYAMATGQIGVTYFHGPGASNALTGIASAFADYIPMLCIGGQISLTQIGSEAYQETSGLTRGLDQLAIMKPVTEFAARAVEPEQAFRMFRMAIKQALLARGPTFVEVPIDLWMARLSPNTDTSFPERVGAPVDQDGVKTVARLMREAKRPMLVLGSRIMHRGISEQISSACDELGIACAAVDDAKGTIGEDHPLYLGLVGRAAHQSVLSYLKDSDLQVLVGVRMHGANLVGYDSDYFSNIVQIDESSIETCQHPVEMAFTGHLPGTLLQLFDELRALPGGSRDEAVKEVARLRKNGATYQAPPASPDDRMTAATLYRVMREVLPDEVVFVTDCGFSAAAFKGLFPIRRRDGYFSVYSLGAMGAGMPLAMGVQAGHPDTRVISISGDGGFLVHTGELHVAQQFELPIIQIVLKNGGWKSVGDAQENFFGTRNACDFVDFDVTAIAKAFGGLGFECSTQDEVKEALEKSLDSSLPCIIRVDMDRVENYMFYVATHILPKKTHEPFA